MAQPHNRNFLSLRVFPLSNAAHLRLGTRRHVKSGYNRTLGNASGAAAVTGQVDSICNCPADICVSNRPRRQNAGMLGAVLTEHLLSSSVRGENR